MSGNERDLWSVSASGGDAILAEDGSGTPGGYVAPVERWLVRKLLAALHHPPVQFVLWDGQQIPERAENPVARVLVRDRWALLRLVAHPSLEFGEMYSAGRIDVDGNLVEFLDAVYAGISAAGDRFDRKILARCYRRQRNTLRGSRHNIHHHYDIGNDFYRMWLDERMLYTCAYFPTESATLEEAQLAKMDHVARKLCLKPGDRVVEAGCGWGSLALHLAKHFGVTVKAYNISKEQVSYARDRARSEGLSGRVEYIQSDYREIEGRYDAFVSVGMLEHVGVENYRQLGAVIDRSLEEEGLALIHTIGRNRPGKMNAWIEKRIFPGAHPPSLSEMAEIFEPRGFSLLDVENLRPHYARTLAHWLARYESCVDQVRQMFGDSFVRAWRLYLAGSEAAFTSGDLQLFQVVFTRPRNNRIPWTREHLYRQGPASGRQ
jgi:cyclopropane-fatty-acyl-phospholipid synthase